MAQRLGVVMIATSAAFLLAGIVWPQAANTLVRLFPLALALGYTATRAVHGVLRIRSSHAFHSPFHGAAAAGPPAAAPEVLRRLTAELGPASDAAVAQLAPIPPLAGRPVADELTRRLAEHYGLNTSDRLHHDRIRALLTEPTWRLLDLAGAEPDQGGPATPRRAPRLSELGRILDDLEKL